MNDDYKYVEPQKMWGTTTWINPTQDKTAKFELLTSQKTGKKASGCALVKVEIKPGESFTLSSEFDKGVRHEDPVTNLVIGGACPWLIKAGEQEANLHPALKAHEIMEKEELYKIADKIREGRDLAEAKSVKADIVEQAKKKSGRPANS